MLKRLLLLSLFATFPLYAAKPLFSIVPVAGYPNKMTIAGNQTAQVRYTVTNNVRQAQTVVFKPQTGLTQVFGAGNCAQTTALNPNQSCTLVLNINAEGLSNISGGPVMCQALNNTTQPNPFFCSEPSSLDMLDITVLSDVYNLNVNVSGLPGSASVSVKDGTTNATYSANGTYTLKSNLVSGASYFVSVTSASNAACTVNNGVGTISGADATVNLVCSSSVYFVGGVISGLNGTISLLNNLQYSVVQSTNATYNFTPVANGSSYSVTLAAKPANQTCTITNPTGIVNGADVSNVNVYCSSITYTLGGTITGIPNGESVTLSNGIQNTTFSSNGSYTFPSAYASGTVYNVSVVKQPDNACCEITNTTGTLNSNVTNVAVTCHALDYTLGGQIYNLTSPIEVTTTLVFDNRVVASTTQTIAQNGNLVLSRIFSGADYNIGISTQAPGQTCQIVNSSGTLAQSSISNIGIYCGDSSTLKTLGGYLNIWFTSPAPPPGFTLNMTSGTNSSNYNHYWDQEISGYPYFFSDTANFVPGTPYNINVVLPVANTDFYCSVLNASGIIPTNSNVTSSEVYCSGQNDKFTISGSISGLPLGESVILSTGQTNFTEILNTNGSFTLSQLFIPKKGSWNLKVSKQPSSAYCTLTNNSGINTNANVTNVGINCSTTSSTLVVQESNVSVPINNPAVITVYNQGPSVVSNLVVNLPSAWLNVTQNASACNNLAVGGNCNIILNASTPYPPASGITISGTNVGTSNSFNIAFLVNGNYVFNVKGNQPNITGNLAYVVKTLNPTSGQMFNTNMPAPSANLAVSLIDGLQNTFNWVTYASGYANSLAYQQCYVAGDYLPSACEWGPAGSSVNSSSCQGSGIYDLVKLGFLTYDPSYYFWTSTQSSSTATSAYAVNPAGSGTMSLNNGSSSNHVVCVNTETF